MTEEIVARRETAEKHQSLVLELYRQAAVGPMAWISAVLTFHDRRYHEALGFPTFDAWIKDMGFSHARVYGGMKVFRALEEYMPAKEVVQIPPVNARWLLFLPESLQKDPTVWKQARTLTEEKFHAFVVGLSHPAALPERTENMKFLSSQKSELLETIAFAKEILATDNSALALSAILLHYRECDRVRKEAEGTA